MQSIHPMREIARIGKSTLVTVIGIAQNYKKELVTQSPAAKECEACLFRDLPDTQRQVCCSKCDHAKQVVYVNEKHQYKLYAVERLEEKRLSKYQVLQFILYHFLGVDSQGIVRYVSVKQVAELLGCTVRTVRNNNDVLADLGLISFSRVGSEYINVLLTQYKQYHLTKEEGGTGYLNLSKEFLGELLRMKQVNTIRLALREHLYFDNEVTVRKQDECAYSYNDIKRFMPKNVSYPKIILALMKPTEVLFDIEARESVVVLKLKDQYNGKLLREQKERDFEERIATFLIDDPVLPSELSDLVQMSFEYGLDTVLNALALYREKHQAVDLKNFGGFVRKLIRSTIYPKLTA